MAQRRYGKPVGQTKIRDALRNARNIDEVYDILDRGRFNLTSSEEAKVISDWRRVQKMLSEHGKGVYEAPIQVVA